MSCLAKIFPLCRDAAGENELSVTPAMIGGYLSSGLLDETTQRLKSKRPLSASQFCSARNCLALTLMLRNGKRPGDIAHMTRSAILQASEPEDGSDDPVEVKVRVSVVDGEICKGML